MREYSVIWRATVNHGRPLAGVNETHRHEEEENPVPENGKSINEFGNTEIETQTEKQ